MYYKILVYCCQVESDKILNIYKSFYFNEF